METLYDLNSEIQHLKYNSCKDLSYNIHDNTIRSYQYMNCYKNKSM